MVHGTPGFLLKHDSRSLEVTWFGCDLPPDLHVQSVLTMGTAVLLQKC